MPLIEKRQSPDITPYLFPIVREKYLENRIFVEKQIGREFGLPIGEQARQSFSVVYQAVVRGFIPSE